MSILTKNIPENNEKPFTVRSLEVAMTTAEMQWQITYRCARIT